MIHIYKKTNLNYRMNGDYIVEPISAKLHLKLNGSWSLDFSIDQADEEVCRDLQHDTVIKVTLPIYGDQLYVVSDPVRTNYETMKATAFPIAMWDSRNELVCLDCRPTNLSGKQALEYVLAACGGNSKYTVESDITRLSTAYYVRKNFMECLAGTDDNAFLNRWGGEIEFDNYTFRVMNRIGANHDFVLSASRNISGFTISEDDTDFCDVIVPVAFNGRTTGKRVKRNGQNGRVDHVRFVEYQHIKLNDDVTGDAAEEDLVCASMEEVETALVDAAKKDFMDGKFLPSFSYSVDYVDLRDFDVYKDLKNASTLWLGDTVKIENLDRGMTTSQKVVDLTYDIAQDQIESIVLGSYEKNYFDAISSAARTTSQVISNNGTVIGDKIAGIIDMSLTSLRAQKTVSKRADVRGILYEDLMVGSSTYGALCIGTQGIQISKQRNADNTDWIWGTCIDYRSIIADYIITGILSGKSGNFYFNLDTGAFELGDGLFHGTISTVNDAKIGRKLYLDFDGTNEKMESGVYLGEDAESENRPRLVLQKYNEFRRIKLLTDNGSLKNGLLAVDGGQGYGDVYLQSGEAHVAVHGGGENDYLELKGKRIFVNDLNGNVGSGITYNGAVSKVKTINGIVTGVEP